MAYDGWELGFESSRSGAGRKQWSRTINFNEEVKGNVGAWDEWERGFESSRNKAAANKKLSQCLLGKSQQVILLDSDVIVWDK